MLKVHCFYQTAILIVYYIECNDCCFWHFKKYYKKTYLPQNISVFFYFNKISSLTNKCLSFSSWSVYVTFKQKNRTYINT